MEQLRAAWLGWQVHAFSSRIEKPIYYGNWTHVTPVLHKHEFEMGKAIYGSDDVTACPSILGIVPDLYPYAACNYSKSAVSTSATP